MRQKLSLQNLMDHFRQGWAKLPDLRKPNNHMNYAVADGVLATFAVFFMQSSSFLAQQRLLQSQKGRSKARSLFPVGELPSDPQIRNLVDTNHVFDLELLREELINGLCSGLTDRNGRSAP